MTTQKEFTELPTVSSSTLNDIICAVQGYISPTILGLSTQQTLQQIYNLFQSNLILFNAGNPNGAVAGTTYQFCWDTINSILYVCTASGTTSTAVWTPANINNGYTTTITSASTTVLTIQSTYWQFFTGSSVQTIVMPVVSTLAPGMTWSIVNNSSSSLTIQSSGLNNIVVLLSGQVALITCILNSGTTAASWNSNVSSSSGGVTSITGTANQVIASTPTGNVTLSLPQNIGTTSSPTFANLTLTNPLATSSGGTGLASIIAKDIFYGVSAGVVGQLSTANQSVLVTDGSGNPSLSTILPAGLTIPGYQTTITGAALTEVNDTNVTLTLGGTPATALLQATSLTLGWTGQLAITRGGTGLSSTTINQILYSSSNNVLAGIAAVNNGVLVYSAGGIPSSSTTLPSGLTIPGYQTSLTLPLSLANGGTNANLTASNGGIFYSTGSAAAILGGTATANQLLLSGSSTTPIWSTSTYPATNAANTLLYASSANTMAALATANNSVLSTNGSGVPSWSTTLPAFTTSSITFNPTTGGIVGTTTNDNAAAGKVGEFISSVILQAGAISVASGGAHNLTSISLTAGDWDVYGNITFIPAASTNATLLAVWTSATSATAPDPALFAENYYGAAGLVVGGGFPGRNAPYQRYSLSTTTTIYISAFPIFSVSTMTMCGGIYARRVR